MKTIKNILVALDLSDIDKDLIKYASFLSESLDIEKVYFVHNIKKYEISELFSDQLKEIDLDQLISDEIDEKVSEYFTSDTEKKVLISEDSYTESLINYIANKYQIDLVMVGNKNNHIGTGIISDKLMRLLKCDILAVPRGANLDLKNIWTGTDFSKESKKVFQLTEILRKKTNSKITAAHIFNVPIQFAPYLDKEETIPRIEKHTKEKFKKFLSKIEMPEIETRSIRGRNASISEKLSEEAAKDGAGLLVVADKGGNVFSSLLVGSVTDELFSSKLKIPLWIVK